MFYEIDLVVPANTLKSAPVIVPAAFVAGTIIGVSVQIPAGCASLVHTAAYDELHQVWPANQDGDIKGDGTVVSWPDAYDVPSDNYTIQLWAWSSDDTFAHTITWRFAFLGAADAARQQRALNALLYLDQWFSTRQGV